MNVSFNKKTAIITVCIGNKYKKMSEITHPTIRHYADRLDAEFVVIDEQKICLGGTSKFEKFQLFKLLESYERIIFLDTDILVSPNCPNLFYIVPPDSFGAFIVSKHTDYHNYSNIKIQDVLGKINWKKDSFNEKIFESFNSGVMVISKSHREVFNPNNGLLETWSTWHRMNSSKVMKDQTLINYTVQKNKIPIFDIGYKFNHTSATNNSKDRFQSHIIHYAGKSHLKGKDKILQIKKDLLVLKHGPLLAAGLNLLHLG